MATRYTVTALARAVDVLELLARQPKGMRLAEITRETGIPKSTLFRILSTLEERRCVTVDDEQGTYRLGLKLGELGNAFLNQSDLYIAATRRMRRLAEGCEESVFLSVLDEGAVVYVRRMENPKSAVVVRKLGQRAPAYCTATGLAMLAFLPDDEAERVLDAQALQAFTAHTTTNRSALRQKLAQVRRERVAVVDGEYNPALLCVASPILDARGAPAAALTVAVLASQARQEQVTDLKEQVRAAAQDVSAELGYWGERSADASLQPTGHHV